MRIVSIGSVALTTAMIAMATAPAFAQSWQGQGNSYGSQSGRGVHGQGGGGQGEGGGDYGQGGGNYGQGGGNYGQGGGNYGQGGGNYGQGGHRQPPPQHRRPQVPQATQLVFTTSPAGGAAGGAETAAVTLENASGQTVDAPAAYAPALTFGGSGIDASPNGTAATATYTYSDGVYTITYTPTDAQMGAVLTAAASGLTMATSAAFNVTPGAASVLPLSDATGGTMPWMAYGQGHGFGKGRDRSFGFMRQRPHYYIDSVTVGSVTDADGNVIGAAGSLVVSDFTVSSSSGNTIRVKYYNTSTDVLTFSSSGPETSSDTWTVTYTNTAQITNPTSGSVSATIAG